jgi:hypothetical protein
MLDPESNEFCRLSLGHGCVVEDPEACATEIRRFVKTLS